MDIQYRIQLLLRALPYGAIVGMIAAITTSVYVKIKTGMLSVRRTDLLRRLLLSFVSALYMTVVLFVFLFNGSRTSGVSVTLPFIQYVEAIRNGSNYLMFNVLLNVIVYIPFGCLVPLNWRTINSALRIFSVSLLTICLIESIQMITRCGAFSFDDLIGGVIGALIGFGLVKIVREHKRYHTTFERIEKTRETRRYVLLIVATTVFLVLSFLHCMSYSASKDIYFLRVKEYYSKNVEQLKEYAESGNTDCDYAFEGTVREVDRSDAWLRLELYREFDGNNLKYHGLFILNNGSQLHSLTIKKDEVEKNGEIYSYNVGDTRYQLRRITEDVFYYMVKY